MLETGPALATDEPVMLYSGITLRDPVAAALKGTSKNKEASTG
jgi:hypothetical protein